METKAVTLFSSATCWLTLVSSAHSLDDWPSVNLTLESTRYAQQTEITPANVAGLKTICVYDIGRQTSFQTGPLVIANVMYVTTDFDTIALDPSTCAVKWRVTEHYQPAGPLAVNRGAAMASGRVFRGTQDGRVLAYDATTGKRLWQTTIADPARGETVPSALLTWDGLVFAGNAGGDNKGVKGRMYALDVATGRIVWEQYLVPREAGDIARGAAAPAPYFKAGGWGNAAALPITGGATWTAYTLDAATGTLLVPGGNPAPDFAPHLRPGANPFAGSIIALDAHTGAVRNVYPLTEHDFHDWDASAAPMVLTTLAGRRMIAAPIKDGYLHAIDFATGRKLYKTAVTTVSNATQPLTAGQPVRFCPGTQGGVEWNGAAYSPTTNLLYTGAVDWCATVTVAADNKIAAVPIGKPWSAMDDDIHAFGVLDPPTQWAGWVLATDADSGEVRWRFKAAAPFLSGITATAGGLVFAGDMAGTLYAFDAKTGASLWRTDTGGAIGGGVISYKDVRGAQRVAVASGMTSPIWPTAKVNAKIVVLGLQ